ncbi:hypothetical protein HFP15_20840 [Amycolatopsis sp. K13G38]|uniref:DUF6194 domain-containing protein n=1 Tax=Amycolatopsis acididurans TaxID=2724524 RepID=A0ABX1J6B4_9PSEU|nr:DUF6194 family protein [Amycolatopsis acididurans]NKQ55337.1 hypothetical protein [Amycolatopsis acididurans]
MTIDDIIAQVGNLGGVLTLRPGPGDGSPEVSWGDVFFYYAPDGVVPKAQPFATIVTKDYPDDTVSGLDRPGVFRVNVDAKAKTMDEDVDYRGADVVFPHPLYGRMGWLSVVNPGPRTVERLGELLRDAHGRARARYERRAAKR